MISIKDRIEYGENGTRQFEDGSVLHHVRYIVLELAKHGEVMDFVLSRGKMTERYARYYFRQMIAGLEALHVAGFVHRDLKIQNTLLDINWVLKINDFGFSAPIRGYDGSGLLDENLGTPGWKAPELYESRPYDGSKIDIFTLGVNLFNIASKSSPFTNPNQKDQWYRHILLGNFD